MKAFDDDCFRHYILNYHGTPVIVEDYQWGDWGDEEQWGSCVYDFKNNKFVDVYREFLDGYGQNPVETLDLWKDEWDLMDRNGLCQNNKVKKYYQKLIEKFDCSSCGDILELKE